MEDHAGNPYLRDAILTASPEQLQLLLYDGAIRFSLQARDAIIAGEIEKSFNLLTRVQRIVSEMQNGLRHEVAPELCGQMASLYNFVFAKLVDANIKKDVHALDDALKILRHQRETWAILVEKVQQARGEVQGDVTVEGGTLRTVRTTHDEPVPQSSPTGDSSESGSLNLEG